MRVAIRVDASEVMGTGHLMRCAALADVLKDRGVAVTFICRDLPATLLAFVKNQGFGICLLPHCHSHATKAKGYAGWLGASWEMDAVQTLSALETEKAVDWLIVDHYGIDHRWEERLKVSGRRIMVIDDMAIQKHACDVLLNQNLMHGSQDRYRSLMPENCRLLVGPRYALLRKEFRNARISLNRRREKVRNLLVFLGGGDPDGVTLRVLKAVDGLRSPELQVTTVLGAANPHRESLQSLYGQHSGYKIIFQAANMAELMMEADLAIGAGGISTWERSSLGLPAIVIAIAENQVEVSKAAAEAGACFYLGASTNVSDEDIAAGLRVMIGNASLRKSISTVCVDLVDGLGCERVARELLQEQVRVRPARDDDAEKVFSWRNAVETRRYSHDPRPLSLESHLKWFRNALADEKRVLLIGEGQGGSVGVLRYDLGPGTATVSVYLDPLQQGRGFAPALLLEGQRWLQMSRPEILRLRAQVQPNNLASRRAFAKAGFAECGVELEKPIGTTRCASLPQDI
ncbi:MAG: UDP-2,4-diacetamido-2,4,6-trideoxy-beta-L-altropyranose hydrolase [Betaproteobacteria bacterium]